jgi:CRISPR-associated endoribonuclease Cas6
MLASFLVHLRPRRLSPLGQTVGRSLHALFLALVRQVDPPLAEALHADSRAKPFTVSMLRGRFVRQGGRSYASPDESYWVRYTVLTGEVFEALSYVLHGKQVFGEPVIIDGQTYDIERLVAEPEQSGGWGRLTSYGQLVDRASADIRISLEFTSPTTVRQGDVNLLFPLPVSVFGGYLRRWQAFSPVALEADDLLDFVAKAVVAERYELATRIVSYGEHQFNGCVGVCQYRVLSRDEDQIRVLNTLADFALFSGTGQKTTQGLGQTRRTRDWRTSPVPGEWLG